MIKQSGYSFRNIFEVNTFAGMVFAGTLLSYMITFLFFVLFSTILTFTEFPDKYISFLVTLVSIAGIFIGAVFSSKNAKSMGWCNGSFVGFFYVLVLFVISNIVFKSFFINKQILLFLFASVLLGAVGGIIGINFGMNKNRKK